MAYAGPASNVRVERASRDCFGDGGAIAEIMSSYENMGVDSPTNPTQSDELKENRNDHVAITVLTL